MKYNFYENNKHRSFKTWYASKNEYDLHIYIWIYEQSLYIGLSFGSKEDKILAT